MSVRPSAAAGLVASMNLPTRITLARAALRSLPERERRAVIDEIIVEMRGPPPENPTSPDAGNAGLASADGRCETTTSTAGARGGVEVEEVGCRTVRVGGSR